jgi:hypothetical protein
MQPVIHIKKEEDNEIQIKKEEDYQYKMEQVNDAKSESDVAAERTGGSMPYPAFPRYIESAFHSSKILIVDEI